MTATSPRTQSKARDPKTVELSWRGLGDSGAGEWGALSSDGATIYTVRKLASGDYTCTCTGYSSRQRCCHVLAAALPRCYWCGSTTDVQTYENGFEGLGAEIQLCDACLTSCIPDCCAEHPAGCGNRHDRCAGEER